MLKNLARLEHKVADRVYHLLCDNDSPLEHVKESLLQFLKYIGNIEDQAKAAALAAESEKEALAEQPEAAPAAE